MKTALVCGSAGFLGSHLVDSLLNDDYIVIGVDNLITGQKKNLEHLKYNSNFILYEMDVLDSEKFLSGYQLDEIYHLASIASPPIYQKYPLQTALSNTAGTLTLLNLAKKNKAKFLFTSTSEVYGNPLEHPQKETYFGNVNSYGPRSCYVEAKRFGETLCYIFKDEVDVKVVRLFNSYGPRMNKNDGRVITNFISQILNDQPLTMYGDGSQTRSFCYVEDTIAGIRRVMERGNNHPYNIGQEDEVTMLEVGKLICKILNKPFEVIFKRKPEDDPVRRKPDITQILQLGWKPKTKFEDGLRKIIQSIDHEKVL